MTRKNQFNYGFDQKPQWLKNAEAEELARLRQQSNARQQLADILNAGQTIAQAWERAECFARSGR